MTNSLSRRFTQMDFIRGLPIAGDGCVLWPYSRNNRGYAKINGSTGSRVASRVVCEHFHGPAPRPDHEAAHSCGKGHEGCIAPWHLSWKTRADNAADRVLHGTTNRGEASPSSKLTEAQVIEILGLVGTKSHAAIAKDYGVSEPAIYGIATGRKWKHVSRQQQGTEGRGSEPAASDRASKLAQLREAIALVPAFATPRKAMTPARKRRIHAQHKGLCTYCGQETEVSGPTVVYDHEIPLELGGSDDDGNIGPIHASPCNKIKTAADAKQIAKMRRQSKMDEPREPSRIQSRNEWPKGQKIQSRPFSYVRKA